MCLKKREVEAELRVNSKLEKRSSPKNGKTADQGY